jgi:putative transposase
MKGSGSFHLRLVGPLLGRVKQLEDENRRLKQVVADLTLDKQILQELLQKKG